MKETLFGGKDWVRISAWSMAAAAAAMASSSPWQKCRGLPQNRMVCSSECLENCSEMTGKSRDFRSVSESWLIGSMDSWLIGQILQETSGNHMLTIVWLTYGSCVYYGIYPCSLPRYRITWRCPVNICFQCCKQTHRPWSLGATEYGFICQLQPPERWCPSSLAKLVYTNIYIYT